MGFICSEIDGFDWDKFKKVMKELYDDGWFIEVYTNEMWFNEELSGASDIEELLEMVERYNMIEHGVSKEELPYKVFVEFRPEFAGIGDEIQLMNGVKACASTGLVSKMDEILEKIKK